MNSFFKSMVFMFIGFSSAAQAADVWHTAQVKYVYPQANGDFVITFKTDSPQCSSTGNPKYHYVKKGINGVTQEGLLMMYSAAMNAGSYGKTLTINYSDASAECAINRLAVNY